VYLCVYAHTHTHCTYGVLSCEPRGRDETPGGPEESRLTSVYMYSSMCTKYTCVCICYETGGDLGLIAFSINVFFFRKRKAKHVNAKPPVSQI